MRRLGEQTSTPELHAKVAEAEAVSPRALVEYTHEKAPALPRPPPLGNACLRHLWRRWRRWRGWHSSDAAEPVDGHEGDGRGAGVLSRALESSRGRRAGSRRRPRPLLVPHLAERREGLRAAGLAPPDAGCGQVCGARGGTGRQRRAAGEVQG